MDRIADAELVERARSGDRGAYGALIERHQPMARRVARGVVGHDETAREMANEAMLQAYLSLDRLRDASRFQSWLFGIVLNVCKGYLRDRNRAPLSLEEVTGGMRFEAIAFTGIEPDPHEVAEAQELHRLVLNTVNSLSPRNRAATLLFYYDQLSVREVAATLSISVAAVKGRLHTARTRMREMLLPVYEDYAGPHTRKREEKRMVKVEIIDVIAKEQTDKFTGQTSSLNILVLLDEENRRLLPLWIGPAEGRAIVIEVRNIEPPRPMTFEFVGRILDATGARLEEVRIEALNDDTQTFLAVAKLRMGDTSREIDARPSDAIALAARTGSPILVAEEVMQKAALAIPEDVTSLQAKGLGLDQIAAEIQSTGAKTHREHEDVKQSVAEENEKEGLEWRVELGRELIGFLYGAEAEEAGEADNGE